MMTRFSGLYSLILLNTTASDPKCILTCLIRHIPEAIQNLGTRAIFLLPWGLNPLPMPVEKSTNP